MLKNANMDWTGNKNVHLDIGNVNQKVSDHTVHVLTAFMILSSQVRVLLEKL